MLLRENFWDWSSLRCNLVHSGRLNLANGWIPCYKCNAKIFNKPQRGGPPLNPPREHHVVWIGKKKHIQAKRSVSVNLGKQDKTLQQMYVLFWRRTSKFMPSDCIISSSHSNFYIYTNLLSRFYTKILLATMYCFFRNKNLFNNLNSLNLC